MALGRIETTNSPGKREYNMHVESDYFKEWNIAESGIKNNYSNQSDNQRMGSGYMYIFLYMKHDLNIHQIFATIFKEQTIKQLNKNISINKINHSNHLFQNVIFITATFCLIFHLYFKLL